MRDRLLDPTPQAGDVLNAPGHPFDGAEFVSCYTRAKAIADGALIDLTRFAPAFGIVAPLAITVAAFNKALRAPRNVAEPTTLEITRLIAWVRAVIHVRAPDSGPDLEAPFTCINFQPVRLKINAGPGDAGELVLTVMLPSED